MDCEKFDRNVLDLFYEELDELTSAAAKRHMEHCTRCRDIGQKLRATRELGALPLVDPPEGLELRILEAEQRARAELPARQRFGRAISVLAGYAMRPQLAMAALLLLVIGSSLMLLRARPGEQKNVLVTERGVPESEADSVAIVPLRDRPAPTSARAAAREERSEARGEPAVTASARAEGAREVDDSEPSSSADDSDRAYAEALGAYRDRKYEDAQRRFDEVNARGGHNAASAALYSAQSVRASLGCPAAAPRFEAVQQRYPETASGYEAAWHAAGCYRTLGDFERARHHYDLLLRVAGYADRAQAALASLGDAALPELTTERDLASAAPRPEGSSAAPVKRKSPKPSP